jgi:tRNA 2-(methylsulfanyl)-N6-isopentenyladenosine37 hydroxylase
VKPAGILDVEALPLVAATPTEWGLAVLAHPISLLVDHAFLEKKAATNALELLTRWPKDWLDGWVEAMTAIARDEVSHLAQVTRIILSRGGRLDRFHKNPYANALRELVRKGEPVELLDRLLVAALIEVRSCERFSVLAAVSQDAELASFYRALFGSERGHYKTFLSLAGKFTPQAELDDRWHEMLAAESHILAMQEPGPRIHSGYAVSNSVPCDRSSGAVDSREVIRGRDEDLHSPYSCRNRDQVE